MKYCTRCGKENNDDVRFCGGCGARFDEISDVTEEKAEANEAEWLNNLDENGDEKESSSETEKSATINVKKAKKNEKSEKTSIGLIIGIASIMALFVPAIQYASPIGACVGIVFSIKELKATGKKTSLLVCCAAAVLSSLPYVISLAASVLGIVGSGVSILAIFTGIIAYVKEILQSSM